MQLVKLDCPACRSKPLRHLSLFLWHFSQLQGTAKVFNIMKIIRSKIMQRIFIAPVVGAWMCFLASSSPAQLLSVDINGLTTEANKGPTAVGFAPWYLGSQTGAGIRSATQYFTNYTYAYDPDTGLPTATNISLIIPCVVTMTYPPAASSTNYLTAKNANKNGYTTSSDPNAGWRLCIDGAMPWWKDGTLDQPNTNGGAISLTISNLPAGVHTITTYHNDPWGPAGAGWHNGVTNISRCVISVNGTPVFTNTPTILATNDSACGFAFFYITNSFDGQPVVLNFDPDHSSALDFTILNGFEINRPSPPGTQAQAIAPTSGDTHAFANNDVPLPGTANAGYLALQWMPAGFAISNYLYFGTNGNAVLNATTASPEFQQASAAVILTTNSFNVTNLNSALTYYWRVDQMDTANGVTNLVKGAVWSFRPRHLAFPTAEGYGRWSRGGRGGSVIEVTNLNDSGPGSYRAAISASGPRTIVFKVSGIIWLQSQCIVGNGYVTIAGQTAPGDGICLANWRAGMYGPNDVIMRYMHFRVGDLAQQSMDAMSPGSATHSIFDHITSSWSLDVACNSLQSGSVGSGSAMTSYQHNIISEPLRYSYHYNDTLRALGSNNVYQPHAFAASISGEIGSYHHNLIAHSTDRNWSLAGGLGQNVQYAGSLDVRNNVVYNWTARTTDGGVDRLNYVNNYYKPYTGNSYVTWLLKLDSINTNWGTEYVYMSGNVMEGKNYYTNNWMSGSFNNGLPLTGLVTNGAEIFPSYVTTQTATNACKVVLSDVGCNLPAEDLIDRRVIGEVLDGTTHYEGTNGPAYTINGYYQSASIGPDYPGMIDSQTDVHDYTNDISKPNYSANYPWPPYATYNVPADSDHDGLPDWWERIRGTNPNSAGGDFSDANADLAGDGYTELERYLNWLAQPHYDCTNGTTLNVELTQYTRGFTNNSPSYVVFNATNGTVALSARTAQFNSTISTNGLGSFMFKVTDASGFSYTNTVNVHILIPTTNTAPVLSAVSSRAINVGVSLSITNAATDADVPAQTLTFSLPVGPTNATLIASNGVFHWRPLVTQADSTNPVTVVVTDSGTPAMSATQSFSVVVNPLTPPTLTVPAWTGGQPGLTVSGQVGPDYAVQGSSNLVNWDTLLITNPATMPWVWSATNTAALPAQFYRIKTGPPLP
jgi:hypothetical protein